MLRRHQARICSVRPNTSRSGLFFNSTKNPSSKSLANWLRRPGLQKIANNDDPEQVSSWRQLTWKIFWESTLPSSTLAPKQPILQVFGPSPLSRPPSIMLRKFFANKKLVSAREEDHHSLRRAASCCLLIAGGLPVPAVTFFDPISESFRPATTAEAALVGQVFLD